jgi:lysine-specific histone demethylase 1
MYSIKQSPPDHNILADTSLLFNTNHEDILAMPLANSAHTKGPVMATAPISGLNHASNGQYSDSTPSSGVHEKSNNTTENRAGQINGKGGCDVSLSGEQSSVNGSDPSHAPSPSEDASHNRQGNHNPPGYVGAATASPRLNVSQTGRTVNGNHLPITINGFSHEGLNGHFKKMENLQHEMGRSPLPSDSNSKSSSLSSLSQSQEASSPHHGSSSALLKNNASEFRARSSIPPNLSPEEFARQSILAADSSRLNPFALHPGEYKLLREHITPIQVTIYLNIRNAILRLWTRNPLVSVSLEEAAGCAREPRYFQMAKVAYYWLMRNGYINFGCLEVPSTADLGTRIKVKGRRTRTIVVIGAGMSGLGCARQMEGLFAQLGKCWTDEGERPPKVIVLEARPRVGGRVYSHQLRNQTSNTLPSGHRCTAEMGAQIVTGFEHGNPMNVIIRAQLGIPYHGLRDNTILYDHDGTIVDRAQDMLVEKLYNDVLERASVYRTKPASYRTVEGDRHLMLFGLDPSDTWGPLISALEESDTPLPADIHNVPSKTEAKPSSGVEKLAGRAYQLTAGYNPNLSAAEAAKTMGWQLKAGVSTTQSLSLDTIAKATEHPTLGETMDDGIAQYQQIVNLTPKDLRLLNWHHANLEYANAANVNQLSLSGWDQDIGNEF